MHPRQQLPTSPIAHPDNVLAGDDWRITVLTPHVVRLEHGPPGSAEDRASQLVLHRDLPPVEMEVVDGPAWLEVRTAGFRLRYDRQPFWAGGLSVTARGGVSNYRSTWRPGEAAAPHDDPMGAGNLGGTARTLDMVDGRTPLDDGLLSRHGIAVVDDSDSLLLDADGLLHPRTPGTTDLYVFAHGRDYRAALDDYHALTGPQPRVPRHALGNWWSRYFAYTADDYTALLDRFAAESLPFSVAVIDMDWHLVDVPAHLGSGWTGYSWNRDLFPDPGAFLADLHDRGLAVTLNVHPADGVRAHEDAYEAMATRMGINPDSGLPVAFDAADPDFLAAYLEEVHHPLEELGVDFWWLDWQQGSTTSIPGLDPLWVLNHLHWLDANRDGRGITFSRWAGLGSHRYPVGFSGDTLITWASLDFQPEFTATAANVGYGWWSHDIGGHFFGVRDDELTTRWVQFGVFSPIMRLHAGADPFNRKEPWTLASPHREVVGDFLRLRHQFVPYLATMARRATEQNRSLVAPMYHAHPWEDEAYRVPNQYAFGTELVVAPITEPVDDELAMGATTAWLPPGDWVDLFTGVAHRGGRTLRLHRPIESIPVLARGGAVLPLVPADRVGNATAVPDALDLVVVPGADGTFVLVEDDDGDRVATTVLAWDQDAARLRVAPPAGDVAVVPATRELAVVLLGFGRVDDVELRVDGEVRTATTAAPDARGAVRVELGTVARGAAVDLVVHGDATPTTSDVAQRVFAVLDRARIDRRDKNRAWDVVRTSPSAGDAVAQLPALDLPPAVADAVTELLLAR